MFCKSFSIPRQTFDVYRKSLSRLPAESNFHFLISLMHSQSTLLDVYTLQIFLHCTYFDVNRDAAPPPNLISPVFTSPNRNFTTAPVETPPPIGLSVAPPPRSTCAAPLLATGKIGRSLSCQGWSLEARSEMGVPSVGKCGFGVVLKAYRSVMRRRGRETCARRPF